MIWRNLWLAAPALLAGCASASQEKTYRDPFPSTFTFTGAASAARPSPRGIIFGDRMIYRGTGAGWYQTNITREASDTGWRILAGPHITVTVEPGSCSETRPYRVAIKLGEETFQGCGGAPVASAGLAYTTWVLRAIAGRAVPDGGSPVATVTFEPDGGFGGTTACNDVGIASDRRWQTDATGKSGTFERIETAGPFSGIQTLMGCPDPKIIEAGAEFWRKMREAQSWSRRGNQLDIVFADGTAAILMLLY